MDKQKLINITYDTIMRKAFISLVILFLVVGVPAFAFVGPVAYVTEQIYADYNTNGTLSTDTYTECSDNSNPCRFGFIEVALPNTDDTLQTVRVNLSGTSATTLNSPETYKGTASSSSGIWAKTKIYVNDSTFGANQYYYKINDTDAAPAIVFNVTSYSNEQGGYDLYDYDNIGSGGSTNNITFVITATNPSTSQSLSSVDIAIRFDLDTNLGTEDAVDITYSSLGTPSSSDGADGYNDQVTWSGSINADTTRTFTIYANIIETDNFPNNDLLLDLDGTDYSHKGVKGDYTYADNTLTGVAISYKYARGPVRQGIDLAERSGGGAWDVRGFIKVLAENSTDVNGDELTYNISSWSIYNVSSSTGAVTNLLQTGTFSTSNFTADYGTLYTTDTTYSSNQSRVGVTGSKPYVASSFDWYVFWNDTTPDTYISYINTTLDLPILYKMDIVPTKTMGGYLAIGAATDFNVTDEATYQGSDNAPVGNIVILSVVPRNTTTSAQRTAFNISNVKVYFNDGSDTEITTNATVSVSITQPAGNSDGLVNVTITDLSQTDAGVNLSNSDLIKITYEVASPSDLQLGDTFNFTGNTTFTSESGTPMTEDIPYQTMSTSGRQLVGYKDLWVPNSAAPTIVNGTLVVQVFGSDISGIKFVDYIPLGTNFTCAESSISFYNSTDGLSWNPSVDINVSNKGTVTLSDGTQAVACEYTNNAGTGWTLGNSAAVKVTYLINITQSGLYEMPMEIAGFDPILGREVRTTAYGVVRIVIPEPLMEPIITQTEFLTARTIVVGNPVSWIKDFEVYNPNPSFTESEFKVEVFDDTTDAYASYLNELGQKVEEKIVFGKEGEKTIISWKTKLAPMETRSYDLRILTPPVLETDRDIEVIRKLEDKMVELEMSIFLRSMAEELYENVALNLPISVENIISIADAFGNAYSYTGGEGLTTLYIDEFEPKDRKEVVVRYEQSYPKIIITPDKERYELDTEVRLDILVLHGGEEIAYPYLETEIYTPNKELVYSNIQDLGRLEPIDKTNVSERFNIPMGVPTGMYVAESRLRSDLATLATGTGNFYVIGSVPGYTSILGYLLILIAIGLLYFSSKRLYSIKKQTN